ncbi:MAG TPA: DNA polymerase III subunit delta [Rhodanobacteraceae bacterium]|nr:DNA polymerase III subunit delta [Rhodanobacteraceae bacterium]
MPTPLPALKKQLAGSELKPVYLIAGAEHLIVLEAADALRARARELGYVERDVLDVESNFDWNRLGDASRELSLFASRKLIDLRLPTGKPGRDGSAAIGEFCAAPPPDTVLLVTANDWSKQHEGAWVKAIETIGVFVPVWPLKREELPDWIGARMASRGVAASPDAIAWLAERIEGNLLAAAQEIDKLALLGAGQVIDVPMLEASVADDARYDAFRLTDAAIGGDAGRALHIVAGLRAEGEELIPLLGWVLNQLRLLLRLSSAANLGAAFKNERIWPARENLFRRALKNSDSAHWERCLAQAARIDLIAKGQQLDAAGKSWGDAWIELERLIAAIAKPRAAAELLV